MWRIVVVVAVVLVLAGCTVTDGADESATTVASESTADASSPVGSTTDEPTTDEPTTDEPTTDEPTTDESTEGTTGSRPDTWTVVEVVDGDTLRVSGPGGDERVRLVGVNAPEVGECYHDEATWILGELVAGLEVRLVRDQSDTDRFDRLLRFVETVGGVDGGVAGGVDGGVDVGAELVRAGAARSQRYEPDVSRNDRYDELQAEAQAAGVGQWAADACGTSTAGAAQIGVEIRSDAPGDDNLNLNEEWVRFTNEGGTALDLAGWLVADESSSHRYRFEALVLEPGASVTLYTGCGDDSSTERFWCNRDSAVWNNSGDTVFLQDPQGNTVLSESYRN